MIRKKKIYVLYHNDWEGSFFLGAFSTKEKADEFRNKFYAELDHWTIEEDNLDPESDVSQPDISITDGVYYSGDANS